MKPTIDSYICLSVAACKRLGFLKPNETAEGVVTWTQGGAQVAAIHLTTKTGAVPCAILSYTYRGTNVQTSLTLRYKPSNLNNGTGYYYFVCPITGLSCRKLYLVGGRFVSRAAFRPLYEKQTLTRTARTGALAFLKLLAACEDVEAERYRRYTYRGQLTPFGRKCEKMAARLERMGAQIIPRGHPQHRAAP